MKMMLKIAGILALVTTTNSAYAKDELVNDDFTKYFSGSVGFVSDYVYRGISQTDENSALQGI
jgi:uncharacterized protein (TIGR02001 family)